MSEALQFDPATHTYTVGGRVVPSVTQVLGPLVDLSKIPRETLEIARQKGTAIHKMAELDARGDLDEDTLPEWMRPVLEQWRKFRADTRFEIIESEQQVYHQKYGYAGTFDLLGSMHGSKILSLIDIKRSFLSGPVIGFQLAAYAAARRKEMDDHHPFHRYALRLNENQPYKLELYDDANDFQSFLTCLSFWKLKQRIT